MKNIKAIIGSSLLAVLLFAGISFAQDQQAQPMQDDGQTTKELAQDLRDRLNLTDDQVANVETILNDYRTNINDRNADVNEVSNAANARIEGLLNEGQVSTWNAVRDSWWKDVNDRYQIDADRNDVEEKQNEEMK